MTIDCNGMRTKYLVEKYPRQADCNRQIFLKSSCTINSFTLYLYNKTM